jgi:beta-lactamase regulating signal transducer with metallopeptidase domain
MFFERSGPGALASVPELTRPFEPVDTSAAASSAAVVVEPNRGVDARIETGRLASIAIAVWMVGFLIVAGRITLSLVALWRLLGWCRPVTDERVRALLNACRIEMGVRRPVALLVAGIDAAPALAGLVFPRILVSQKTLDSFPSDELRWLFCRLAV